MDRGEGGGDIEQKDSEGEEKTFLPSKEGRDTKRTMVVRLYWIKAVANVAQPHS